MADGDPKNFQPQQGLALKGKVNSILAVLEAGQKQVVLNLNFDLQDLSLDLGLS